MCRGNRAIQDGYCPVVMAAISSPTYMTGSVGDPSVGLPPHFGGLKGGAGLVASSAFSGGVRDN